MEKTEGLKRKALNDGDYARKTKKQWRTPKKKPSSRPAPTLDPEGAGIWATCDMHKEGRATTELRDLFEDYAAQIYGQLGAQSPDRTFDGEISKHTQSLDSPCEEGVQLEEQSDELEDQIAREVQLIKNPVSASTADPAVSKNLFQAVRLDTPCLLFFKTVHPIDPASFVHTICHDISIGKILRRSKYVRRLTPVSRLGKATSMGLEQVAKAVLADVFDGKQGLKFAIRPTIRNHNTLKREEVIQKVAKLVGAGHTVNLKGYDYLILVDIYRNVLGMSVVGNDFETLRRYNLCEIYDATLETDKLVKSALDTEPKSTAPPLMNGLPEEEIGADCALSANV